MASIFVVQANKMEDVPQKNAPMPSIYRIGPDQWHVQNPGEYLQ